MLCGSHKVKGTDQKPENMVQTSKLVIVGDKSFPIKSSKLDCKSAGIYVGVCTQPNCTETYTGKTSTKFSTRFNGHRLTWAKAPTTKTNRDDTAFLDHYRDYHPEVLNSWQNELLKGFDKAFKIFFVDNDEGNLTTKESEWQNLLRSSINRCTISTPYYKIRTTQF